MKILLAVLLLYAACRQSVPYDPHAGGTERWAVKTGADVAARLVDASPSTATVVALRAMPVPRTGGSTRHAPVEFRVYSLDCWVDGAKLEADRDLHLVISDAPIPVTVPLRGQPTMIAEIPDSVAVNPSSPWRAVIAQARRDFAALAGIVKSRRLVRCSVHVRLQGVGFFDRLHGQDGLAPNGVELHPVLRVSR